MNLLVSQMQVYLTPILLLSAFRLNFLLGWNYTFRILNAKMAKEPLNQNNLVSRLLLEENSWITSRALKARFWPRKSSL